jgi:hypothetical protein
MKEVADRPAVPEPAQRHPHEQQLVVVGPDRGTEVRALERVSCVRGVRSVVRFPVTVAILDAIAKAVEQRPQRAVTEPREPLSLPRCELDRADPDHVLVDDRVERRRESPDLGRRLGAYDHDIARPTVGFGSSDQLQGHG